ncbi:MAG: GGDEF domain-containing protein [Halopseudomonas sp.]
MSVRFSYLHVTCWLLSMLPARLLAAPANVSFDWRHPYAHLGFGLLLALIVVVLFLQQFNRRLRLEVERRWRIEDQLRDSQHRLSLALWGADLGCWDWDMDQNLLYIDERAAYLLEEQQGACQLNLDDGGQVATLFSKVRQMLDEGELEGELELELDGRSRWLLIKGRRLAHENSAFRALGTLMDISEAKAYRDDLEILSITDSLTGVYNRRYFFDRLVQACSQVDRSADVISLAMLDIDFFKRINDQHGHQVGDQVLIKFTCLLKSCCRPYDLIARYGGEEFVVLFSGIDKQQAQTALQRYADALLEITVSSKQGPVGCTFSAGIVDSSEPAMQQLDCMDLIELADQRMYWAKQCGRNRIELIGQPQ